MASPMNGFRYVHKAIRAEAASLGEAAQSVAPADGDQATGLAARYRFLRAVVKGHQDGEEVVLFPALEEKVRHVSRPYVMDHEAEREVFQEIEEALTSLRSAADDGERERLIRRVNRASIALDVSLSHHSRKEDELLLPLVDEYFSVGEQVALAGRIVGAMPRELMPRILPWMIASLDPTEREEQLRLMKGMLPPPMFATMAGWVKGGVRTEVWADLVARIPELASVS